MPKTAIPRKDRQKLKYGAKISLKAQYPKYQYCRSEGFRETRQCDMLYVWAQEHPAYIIKTFSKVPILFWDEQSDIFGKASVSSLRDLELTYHVTLFE